MRDAERLGTAVAVERKPTTDEVAEAKSRISQLLGRSSVVLSEVMERTYRKQEFEQRKSTSVLLILSLRVA